MAHRQNPFGDPAAHHGHTVSDVVQNHAQHQHSWSRDTGHSRSNSSDSVRSAEGKRRFRSYRLVGPYPQPWVSDKRMYQTRYNNFIVYGFGFVGICLAAVLCILKWRTVPQHDYCLVLDENFATLDPKIWNHEVQLDGFGSGSFDWTTTDPTNSYVSSDGLHIMPTLTNETTYITNDEIQNGYTLNLTSDGTCTSNLAQSCQIQSNNTKGYTIPPVRSARLNTKGKATIKYGRVEIVAKLPRGDWLWPAIWMMPEDSVYGPWPASGEIDIIESRGNDYTYSMGGNENVISTLHWAPAAVLDAFSFYQSLGNFYLRRTDFTQHYHTFGLEWSKDYMFTYVDSRLHQILSYSFTGSKTLWERGGFASATINQTNVQNPWAGTGNMNTPFDQPFYLVLNVAVGARNGWFKDNYANKPWIDQSDFLAPGSFWQGVNQWLPTWGAGTDRGMTVKSVKMWQEGKCGSF